MYLSCGLLIATIVILVFFGRSTTPTNREIKNNALSGLLCQLFNLEKEIGSKKTQVTKRLIDSLVLTRDFTENECTVISNANELKSALGSYYVSNGHLPPELDSIFAIDRNMLVERLKFDYYHFSIFYKAFGDACVIGSRGQNERWDITGSELERIVKSCSTSIFFNGDDILIKLQMSKPCDTAMIKIRNLPQ